MMTFLKFVCCDFSCLVLFHSTCPFLSQQHISFLNNLFFYILFRNFFFPPITDHCLMLNLLSKSFRYQFAERQPFVNAEYQLNRTEHATSQRINLGSFERFSTCLLDVFFLCCVGTILSLCAVVFLDGKALILIE